MAPAQPGSTTVLFPTAVDLLPGADTGRSWPPLPELSRACLRGYGLRGRLLEWLCRHRPGRWLLRAFERIAVPGLATHFLWRKRWIGRRVREYLGEDGQLLILGPGFDPLGLQVARRMPATRVFECDLPAQIARKRLVAQDLCIASSNWYPLAADLGRRCGIEHWANRLSTHPAWRPQAATVIVAEGLAMYLPAPSLRRLLVRLRALLTDRAVLIATAMDQRSDGRAGFATQAWWIDGWLQRSGEPFRWGLGVDQLHATTTALGLTGLLRADPLAPGDPDPSPGEHVFLAHLACARDHVDRRRMRPPTRAPRFQASPRVPPG